VFIEALNYLYLVDAIGLGGSREVGLFEFEYLMVEVVVHGDDVGFSRMKLGLEVQVHVFSFLLQLLITVCSGSGGLFLARSDFQLVEGHPLMETYFYY
jgi:hypothetical protein